MADPFSVASGAAGVISLGLTVFQGLITFHQGRKSKDEDVKIALQGLDSLAQVLQHLHSVLTHGKLREIMSL